MNYFHLLNIPQNYDIDRKELIQKYYDLQAKYHPDVSKSPVAKQQNLALSTEINKAYDILKDDLTRAEHLLDLIGYRFDEKQLPAKLNPQELEKILEEQEELEEMRDSALLEKFYQAKLLEQKSLFNELSQCFQMNKPKEILDVIIRLKYLKRLIESIQSKI